MRWDPHVEGQDDPNGDAQLIRLSDGKFRPIFWLSELPTPKRKVTRLVGETGIGKVVLRPRPGRALSHDGGRQGRTFKRKPCER